MKWVTRSGLHVDRTACSWLILHHIDSAAEFVFVSAATDPGTIAGHSFDMRAAEFTHEAGMCTFEVMLQRHGLAGDAALVKMGRIIRDADVPARGRRQRESGGLDAIMRGVQLSFQDDYEKIRITAPFYDALYAYCEETVREKPRPQATPRPRLRYSQRIIAHLEESSESPPDS